MQLLCTGAWVLRGFELWRCKVCAQALVIQEVLDFGDAVFVHRRLGFKRFLHVACILFGQLLKHGVHI